LFYREAFFVTRARQSGYRVEEHRYADSSKGIRSDQIIQLSSVHVVKCGAPLLRRIGCRDAATGKFYEFLTNSFTLAATTIAAIYKRRVVL
jgi:hypothetical protein